MSVIYLGPGWSWHILACPGMSWHLQLRCNAHSPLAEASTRVARAFPLRIPTQRSFVDKARPNSSSSSEMASAMVIARRRPSPSSLDDLGSETVLMTLDRGLESYSKTSQKGPTTSQPHSPTAESAGFDNRIPITPPARRPPNRPPMYMDDMEFPEFPALEVEAAAVTKPSFTALGYAESNRPIPWRVSSASAAGSANTKILATSFRLRSCIMRHATTVPLVRPCSCQYLV